eukprot:CAMPEP_0204887450 /NCGR_PEP_ID=MMETSP1349-20130617/17861_1 /ASSEMBLY_ACC=CAM_ASM_000710 /TAXON_ID=215587 /ORGANISM="Aplanochytrium stocchinoi, Strain GSBS06" /LENGTH=147 /DNA_ID=CAMNT_0052050231 /DNA_START=407 /DNA_END=851 /DNA_ORIENTATION=-
MEQNCKLKDTNIGRTRRPTSNVDLNEDKIRLIKLEKLIFRDLKARLHKGEPTVINYLSKLFPSCQYPDSLQNYCVYCHKSYFLEDAKEEACTVPHDIDDYADEDGGDGNGALKESVAIVDVMLKLMLKLVKDWSGEIALNLNDTALR